LRYEPAFSDYGQPIDKRFIRLQVVQNFRELFQTLKDVRAERAFIDLASRAFLERLAIRRKGNVLSRQTAFNGVFDDGVANLRSRTGCRL
jgi:hypothetical protein